jgi:hypothetical protein
MKAASWLPFDFQKSKQQAKVNSEKARRKQFLKDLLHVRDCGTGSLRQ